MKIFIAWSGKLSHNVALLLRKWIPNVIQSAEPFISSEDFEKGAFWSGELIKKFTECKFSLICVSKENIDSRWLNFEAGAMLKTLKEKKNVSPILIDLEQIELKGPLGLFQTTKLDQEDVFKLIKTINQNSEKILSIEILQNAFDRNWKGFKKELTNITTKEEKLEPKRISSDEKIDTIAENIEEILLLVRSQQNLSSEIEGGEFLRGKYTREDFNKYIQSTPFLKKQILGNIKAKSQRKISKYGVVKKLLSNYKVDSNNDFEENLDDEDENEE